ncbi:MAG: SUMF1/EgtB/PvdO family nonheme iron enzyme [Anaerolineae bacterium]|nr:SUMF1/EgtB/PvdO family nonheme iron enzyme [Anaerolineae bacterium]
MMGAIILVVDDNPDLVDGVKLTLEMEGYQVLTATSGEQALDVLGRITPDLILADIMMPGVDGYELYDKVHEDERWVQVPFIFLTAKTNKDDISRGKEMGVDDYITKPFDPQVLVSVVRGRLKRMAELTGRGPVGDPMSNLRLLWSSKIGPVPVPLIALLIVAALVGIPLLFTQPAGPQNAYEPLRADVNEMVLIPAGPFTMGATSGGNKAREVNLPEFQIDKYEVTYQQYEIFISETGHSAPWGSYPEALAGHPIINVTWEDAYAYCEWAGKRLPTDAEWEKAARGDDGRIYPWGDEWNVAYANTSESGVGSSQVVGSYPDGASYYGVMDMAGNVWEWVDDWANADQENKIIRGGAWNAVNKWAQTFAHNEVRPNYAQDSLGFRCARSGD